MPSPAPKQYDVYGVGNAIVDTEVRVDDAVLAAQGLQAGVMTLVTHEAQQALLGGLDGREMTYAAGGSAANTMVGVAQFGGTAYYAGKVGNDMAGALYRESLAEAGVGLGAAAADVPTGTCLILVTPDGERTMQTHLGASALLGPSDIHADHIAASAYVYVEGYLWSSATAMQAAEAAIHEAASAGVRVALSLSDPSMVEHFRDTFRAVAAASADVVFCNEREAMLYAGLNEESGSPEQRKRALRALAEDAPLVFMTLGADGSLIWDGGVLTHVPGHRVPVVDTTGAGDIYAAGVLYGLTHGLSAPEAAKLGSYASAIIVTQMGPRLREPLAGKEAAILAGARP